MQTRSNMASRKEELLAQIVQSISTQAGALGVGKFHMMAEEDQTADLEGLEADLDLEDLGVKIGNLGQY